MSRLDDIERRLGERMAAIERRINGEGENPVTVEQPQPMMQAAVQGGWPTPPVDDSAPATLNLGDLSSVSALEFRLAGLKPGDKLPLTGGRFAGDPQDEYDKFWAVVVDGARKANVYLGSCSVNVKNAGDRKFDGPTVFCRGIPEPSADPGLQVQRFVAMAAAYYLRRWKYFGVNDVHTLWALAKAVFKDGELVSVSYDENAFCCPGKGGFAYLCFSPIPGNCNQDTAGHEFTHAVSQNRIDWLEYAGEIGAINESFSDIFAKFGAWAWNGREMADSRRWIYSHHRNMAHPENSPKGEKVGWVPPSYYLQPPQKGKPNSGWYRGTDDNGGVHVNNSVVARLCFLLCEGERFVRDDGRGFDVKPIGFDRTEELFGQLMFGPRRYLPKACSIYSFYNGIALAAEDLGFSPGERERLVMACDAVNIIPPQESSKFGSVASMERKLGAVRSNVPGTPAVHYANALAQEFAYELGLNVSGTGFSVVEEDVTKPADLHAAVPTGGEVQVVMEQTWNGLPVYGASAIARVRDGDTVTYLENGFSSSLGALQSRATMDSDAASQAVLAERIGQTVTSAQKIVFDPKLLGMEGPACVAWLVKTEADGIPQEQCIVDACSGKIVHSSPLRIVG